jgi:hypothetical protein
LAWLPPTAAAVSLRLAVLDAHLLRPEGPLRDRVPGYCFVVRPGKFQNLGVIRHSVARPPLAPHLQESTDPKMELVYGSAVNLHGRIRPAIFPCFPYRSLFTPREEFSIPVPRFQADVAAGNDSTPLIVGTGRIKVPGLGSGRGRGRGRGRGGGRAGGIKAHRGHRGGGAAGTSGMASKGAFGRRGGRGGSGYGHRSALGRELGARSDSDRHYGSDSDEDEEAEEEEAEEEAEGDEVLGGASKQATKAQKQSEKAVTSKNKGLPASTELSSDDESISDVDE